VGTRLVDHFELAQVELHAGLDGQLPLRAQDG